MANVASATLERSRHSNEYAGVTNESAQVKRNQLVNALSIFCPIALAAVLAAFLGRLALPTLTTVIIFATSFGLTVIGVSVGFHRYFTHNAFKASPSVRAFLAVTGSWAMQGPLDRWVADHRRHHRYTDAPLDPHSPYWIGQRRSRSTLEGLLHAHFLWMFDSTITLRNRYAVDIGRDSTTRWCSRHYWTLAAISVIVPAIVGMLAGGYTEAIRCLLWAGCFRVILLHHLTWSVNSFGHAFGSKVQGSRSEARDNIVLALLLIGEGLHSYHHAHPSAAVNEPSALDAGGWLIRIAYHLGLVRDLQDCRFRRA